jgi:aspartate dehydrogenase
MVVEVKVGLIGCGAIGSTLARGIIEGKAGDVKLVAICDALETRVDGLKEDLSLPGLFTTTMPNELIAREDVEFVIEAASQTVVHTVAETALTAGKDIMIMSVGALRDGALADRLKALAEERGVRVYLPSGAICGLDGVKAASVEGITRAEITSTKHPRSLEGAPYLVENKISLRGLTQPKIVFRGRAKDAAKGFPKNVNVAVALSLAGVGVDRTMVTIIADPEATRTQHEIRVVGAFGDLYTMVKNYVHPENPKTSYLAALAAIRTLGKRAEVIQVGT